MSETGMTAQSSEVGGRALVTVTSFGGDGLPVWVTTIRRER
jgi:hypothetical protein